MATDLKSIENNSPAVTAIFDEMAGRRNVRPLDRVFLERGIRGLVSLTLNMESNAVEAAVAETDDLEVLIKGLESKAGLRLARRIDPLAAARIRGLQMKRELLQRAGGTLQPREVAELLGMSRQAVGKRRRAGKLVAVQTGRRGYEYPACQFEDTGAIENLEKVLGAFADDTDAWMQLAFLINPNESLGGESPLDLLRRGETDTVVQAARTHGEHGAR
jgi:hypothetical protein